MKLGLLGETMLSVEMVLSSSHVHVKLLPGPEAGMTGNYADAGVSAGVRLFHAMRLKRRLLIPHLAVSHLGQARSTVREIAQYSSATSRQTSSNAGWWGHPARAESDEL